MPWDLNINTSSRNYVVVILFYGTLTFSKMEVGWSGIDTLWKMREKKTATQRESMQDDALQAAFFFFFSHLFRNTLTLFCILALVVYCLVFNKQKLHRYTGGWDYANYSLSNWSAVIVSLYANWKPFFFVCVCVWCHELELLDKYHELEEFDTIHLENTIKKN